MSSSSPYTSVAVIGAGVAGAACAASLHRAGLQVTLFDKSRGVGGRMATRRAGWTDAKGHAGSAEFDHGAQHFIARQPRFRAVMARAQAAGCAAASRLRVHRAWPGPREVAGFVAVPNMPALCQHLLAGVPLRLGQAVQRLQRSATGWQIVIADGDNAGPFDHVMLAMPPAQAALLLAGHADAWADTLAAVPMTACWTLMAVTDDVDWPWDAAVPGRGPLAWVARNDRKPGRERVPGGAVWVAHATPAWSAEHLEDDPESIAAALGAALAAQLPHAPAPGWLHRSVHRWRYAVPAAPLADSSECWWDPDLGLGICGDFLGGGDVEAAWRSGDELADTVGAWLEGQAERAVEAAAAPRTEATSLRATEAA
jgi:predicted NAD/FAD-dependent oxidoreductase